MKKAMIIIASILLGAGLLIFIGGLLLGGGLKPVQFETKTYPVTEPVTGIRLDTHKTDVLILPSPDGTLLVSAAEAERIHHTVTVQDGTLRIETVDERTWFDMLFPTHGVQMIVYLPETSYQSLSAECRTGEVEIAKDFVFDSIDIKNSTGSVKCAASANGRMKIEASTGDITLENVRAEELWLAVSTGGITVNGAEIQKGALLTVSTGRLEIDGLSCESLTTTGSTGRVTLQNVGIEHALWIERGTGDVTLENVGAETVTVHTGTGDVTASLRSEMYFVTETSTGKVSVPDTHGGGRCEIKTSTGDITVSYVQNP
jgi:hypothetical protein